MKNLSIEELYLEFRRTKNKTAYRHFCNLNNMLDTIRTPLEDEFYYCPQCIFNGNITCKDFKNNSIEKTLLLLIKKFPSLLLREED